MIALSVLELVISALIALFIIQAGEKLKSPRDNKIYHWLFQSNAQVANLVERSGDPLRTQKKIIIKHSINVIR